MPFTASAIAVICPFEVEVEAVEAGGAVEGEVDAEGGGEEVGLAGPMTKDLLILW